MFHTGAPGKLAMAARSLAPLARRRFVMGLVAVAMTATLTPAFAADSATLSVAQQGQVIVVTGDGFPASVRVTSSATVGGQSGKSDLMTDGDGSLVTVFLLPSDAGGELKITARGGGTSATVTHTLGDDSTTPTTAGSETTTTESPVTDDTIVILPSTILKDPPPSTTTTVIEPDADKSTEDPKDTGSKDTGSKASQSEEESKAQSEDTTTD